DALTARVEALAARVDALADQVNSLAVQVTSLAEAQQRTQQQLDTLTLRVESVVEAVALTNRNLANLDAKFRGYELEDRYRRHASGYFGGLLRRMRVHDDAAVVDQYEDRFPREAMLDLLRADMLVHGQVRDAPERGDV